MASSGEVGDCNRLNDPSLSEDVGEATVAAVRGL